MGALVTILEMQDKIADLEKRLEDAEERLEAWRLRYKGMIRGNINMADEGYDKLQDLGRLSDRGNLDRHNLPGLPQGEGANQSKEPGGWLHHRLDLSALRLRQPMGTAAGENMSDKISCRDLFDFDRRVDIHFQSHVSNSSGETIKLSADSKRWTATIYDQWSILPDQVVGAKTLEELLTLPALKAVRTQSVEKI